MRNGRIALRALVSHAFEREPDGLIARITSRLREGRRDG